MSQSSKKFQRTIEDFVCAHCTHEVKGTGYTNHCPKCLWSKHVDIKPGDRRELCHGLMQPVGSDTKTGDTYVVQECIRCGHRRSNKIQKEDDFDELVRIVALRNEKRGKGLAR